MVSRFKYGIILLLLVLFHCFLTFAQEESVNESPVYLQVNSINKNKVFNVWDETLNLQYNDAYGRNSNILLRIFDWKRNQVTQVQLGKDKGVNSYTLDLNEVLPGRDRNKVYTFSMADESGKKYAFLVRFVDPPKRNEIAAGIFLNPKYLNCDDEISGNLVEVLGSVSEGKTPYTITWYVLNANRTEFLYQPKVQKIDRSGITASILVDKSPDYFVIMTVVDDCQSEQHQVVHVVCENGLKKVNTVFFESVREMITPRPTQ